MFSRFLSSYDVQLGNGVGLLWSNGKGWKSKNIDKASKRGKREKYNILKDKSRR